MILSKELIETVMQKVSSGMPYKYACIASGVAERTFHFWKSEGEEFLKRIDEAKKNGEEPPVATPHQELLLHFLQSLKVARAQAIDRNVALINVAAQEHWQAAAWWLERIAHEDFGRKDTHKLDHSGNIDGTLTLAAKDIARMSTEEKIAHGKSLQAKMDLLDAPDDEGI